MNITEKINNRMEFIKTYLIELNLEGVHALSDDELTQLSKAYKTKIEKLNKLASNNPSPEEGKNAENKAKEFEDNLKLVDKEVKTRESKKETSKEVGKPSEPKKKETKPKVKKDKPKTKTEPKKAKVDKPKTKEVSKTDDKPAKVGATSKATVSRNEPKEPPKSDLDDTGSVMGNKIKSGIADILIDPKERKEYILDLKDELEDLIEEYGELKIKLDSLDAPEDEEQPEDDTEDDTKSLDTDKEDEGEGNKEQWLERYQVYKSFRDTYAKGIKILKKMRDSGSDEEKQGVGKSLDEIRKINKTEKQEWKDFKNKNKIGKGQEDEGTWKALLKSVKKKKQLALPVATEGYSLSESIDKDKRDIKSRMRKIKIRVMKIKEELFEAKFYLKTLLKIAKKSAGIAKTGLSRLVTVK
jgi:hypothetical protein